MARWLSKTEQSRRNKRIKELASTGLDYPAIAERIGISKSQVCKIVNGRRCDGNRKGG